MEVILEVFLFNFRCSNSRQAPQMAGGHFHLVKKGLMFVTSRAINLVYDCGQLA
jgi:hypothetical protein